MLVSFRLPFLTRGRATDGLFPRAAPFPCPSSDASPSEGRHRHSSVSTTSLDDLRRNFRKASSNLSTGIRKSIVSIPSVGLPATPASPQAAAFSPRPAIHLPLHQRLLYHLLSLAFTRYRVVVVTEDQATHDARGAFNEEDPFPETNPSLNGTIRIVPDRRGVHEIFKNWLRKKPRVAPATLPTSP